MRMFRGLSATVWTGRLIEAGWPEDAAEIMAHWLTDPRQPVPHWSFLQPGSGVARNASIEMLKPKGG